VVSERNYDASNIAPLINLANTFDVLDLGVRVETLVETAVEAKIERHNTKVGARVAFISHSSKDKPFVRQLAADLVAAGVQIWLDEQRIRVGDSIPERIAQGVAESDFFLVVISADSVKSAWVQKELIQARTAADVTVSLTVDSSLDGDKLGKQLELLRHYGLI
jgi:predicted peroxiredoxin